MDTVQPSFRPDTDVTTVPSEDVTMPYPRDKTLRGSSAESLPDTDSRRAAEASSLRDTEDSMR